MIPHRSQFRQYSDRHSDSVWVGNLQHCPIIGIGTIELNLYIPKLSFSDHQFCEHCQYDKQVIASHLTSAPRESSPLDLVQHSGLSDGFWAEALLTVVHIINMLPSRPLGLRIPQEIWTGSKPNYDKLVGEWEAACAEEGSLNVLLLEEFCVWKMWSNTVHTHRERERGTKSYIFISKRQQLQMNNNNNNNLCKRLQSHFI